MRTLISPPRIVSLLMGGVLCGIILSGHAAVAGTRHPISITEAAIYVQRDKISVKIDVFAEDLYLFHNVKPNADNFLEPQDLAQAKEVHKQFLLDRFLLRDAAGELLQGEVAGVDEFEMPADGIPMGDLMNYRYGYRFDYPLDAPIEFLTVAQQMLDQAAGIPAEMQVRLKQEGSENPYYAVLNPGEPMTIRLNWDHPPLAADATEEEWEEWLTKRREEALGITSYSSIYSFLYIDDHEIRHEILAPLLTLESSVLIPRRDDDFLQIDEQPEAAEQIGAYLAAGNPLLLDGVPVTPVVDRVDFYGVDFRDFAQRAPEQRVSMANARAGVILRYPLTRPPDEVSLTWDRFSRHIWNVRTVIYAYEDTESKVFSRYGSDPSYHWKNPGRPPLPEISPVESEEYPRARISVPLLSLICILAAPLSVLTLWSWGAPRWSRFALAAGLGAIAGIVWPLQHAFPDPFADPPSVPAEVAQDIFTHLHGNLYRAFDYSQESDIYDALARSVDGPLLEELYLQVRRGLTMQEQGGAISRISDVKILLNDIRPTPARGNEPPSFDLQCRWTVEGTVEHWGHIHARTNQYDALFYIAQREGAWKIVALDLLDEKRVNFETRLRGL
jgi:hypothetical protein